MKVSSSESLTSLVKVENAKQATLEARKTLEAVKTNAANVQSLGLKVNKSMSSKGQAVVQGSIKQLQNAVDNMEAEMSRQSKKVWIKIVSEISIQNQLNCSPTYINEWEC